MVAGRQRDAARGVTAAAGSSTRAAGFWREQLPQLDRREEVKMDSAAVLRCSRCDDQQAYASSHDPIGAVFLLS